jgi:hypothetical protein
VINLPGAIVPDAEIDSDGTVHVAYLSGNDIFYVKSEDGGTSFSEPLRVNSQRGMATGGLFRGPDLSLGKGNRVHVGWYNHANSRQKPEDSEQGFLYSRTNEAGTVFEASRFITGKPSDNYSLAADGRGNLAAVWVREKLHFNLSNDGGENFASPSGSPADPCECCGTRAAYSPGGALFVLYRDKQNNDRDMYLARPDRGENSNFPVKLNTETWHIKACPLSGSYLSINGNHLLAAWELIGGIFFSRLSTNGEILTAGEIKVSDYGKYPVVLASGRNILVAWKDGTSLQWQMFDLEGNRQGETYTVETSNNGHRPGGVVLPHGRFLLFP